MKRHPDGKAFVVLVSSTTGRELHFGELIGELYESCSDKGCLALFSDLAFVAKSFQKLKHLLDKGISDETVNSRLSMEAEDTFNKFVSLLSEAADCLPDAEKKDMRDGFLAASGEAISKTVSLLEDVSGVKDFFLSRRDLEGRR